MRALLALLCFAPLVANSGDRLTGQWRSDHDASMRFIRAHAILAPSQTNFLNGMLGRLELTFDGSKIRYRMPDFDVVMQGKSQHFMGPDYHFDYRVLGIASDSIALLIVKLDGQEHIWHVHFVNDNSFWIYSGAGDYGLRDLNFREYFRREK